MFHRVDMHNMLMSSAVGEGIGTPAKLEVDHKCLDIDVNAGVITFENGVKATHDLIVGADGIGVCLLIIISSSQMLTLVTSQLYVELLALRQRRNSMLSS